MNIVSAAGINVFGYLQVPFCTITDLVMLLTVLEVDSIFPFLHLSDSKADSSHVAKSIAIRAHYNTLYV